MDALTKQLSGVDWASLRRRARHLQAAVASGLKNAVMTAVENDTRAATSDTPTPPSIKLLSRLATESANPAHYPLIMAVVWARLASRHPRCVEKALELLAYLLRHGDERVIVELHAALPQLESFHAYPHPAPRTPGAAAAAGVDDAAALGTGADAGTRVRAAAAEVTRLLGDRPALRAERAAIVAAGGLVASAPSSADGGGLEGGSVASGSVPASPSVLPPPMGGGGSSGRPGIAGSDSVDGRRGAGAPSGVAAAAGARQAGGSGLGSDDDTFWS
ncbi:hypothetical protein MMPV_007873 [Pyropia vietnamensis]